MITDQMLDEFLQNIGDTPTSVIDLRIASGTFTDTTDWQLHFKGMSALEMYNEYKLVINQLMFAQIDDVKRMALFDLVNQAVSVLVGQLRHSYQTQPGILDEQKQQALDSVLSVYYLGIIFYHVIWQRAAARPNTDPKKSLLQLFNRKSTNLTTTPLIQHCLYGIMVLLRQSLFEKYIGYRQDTQVLWQYLNAYYRFALANEWGKLVVAVNMFYTTHYTKNHLALSLNDIYYHCLTVAIINPYACRRSDMLAVQKAAVAWSDDLIISRDLVEKPYMYVDLEGNQPPKVLEIDSDYNPFAATSNCLFIAFSRLEKRLSQIIIQSKISNDNALKNQVRQAKLMYHNLQTQLKPVALVDINRSNCEVVLGFQNIHYRLANRTSLGNLIYANELAEQLKPRLYNTETLNKSTVVTVKQDNAQVMCLSHVFNCQQASYDHHPQINRGISYHPFNQIQVNSLIAVKKPHNHVSWRLGFIKNIYQNVIHAPVSQPNNKTCLQIEVSLEIYSQNAIPCGIRILNSGSRPPYFVPAFIIPKDLTYQHNQTSLLMARFGYHVDDRLIIRLDNKQINIRLTRLLNMTDDIEEYAFVKIQ